MKHANSWEYFLQQHFAVFTKTHVLWSMHMNFWFHLKQLNLFIFQSNYLGTEAC